MKNYPRIICANGVSLSVQASETSYCLPQTDDLPHWQSYAEVEVGFIKDPSGNPFTPPESWAEYATGPASRPCDVYAFVPTATVQAFITDHGGSAATRAPRTAADDFRRCAEAMSFDS